MKALKYSLLAFMATVSLSCGLGPVERETSIEASVQLNTGEPVENYPLSIVATNGSIYGGSNLVSRQDFLTDKKGSFSYQGVFKTGLGGLGYQLQWGFDFRIQGQAYSVDTVQANIPDARINITPTYKFNGYLFPGKDHRVKIILKKDR